MNKSSVGKLKNRSPKILCSLEFSLVTFFGSRQRTEQHRKDRLHIPTNLCELDEVKVTWI